MKVNGLRIKNKEMELINGLEEENILVNGKTTL